MLLPKMLLCCDPPEVLYRTEKRTEDKFFSWKSYKMVFIAQISQF